MKVYLDDVRPSPKGWVLVRWPEEAIELLKTGEVEEISLDHDLGDINDYERTGYDVLLWLEEQAALGNFKVIPKHILTHTGNTSAEKRMWAAIKNIEKLRSQPLP
jgi:hypothetical protein